jgi:hypothetical protein
MQRTLDDLRAAVWRAVVGVNEIPTDETEFLHRISLSSQLDCHPASTDLPTVVRALAERLGEDPGDDLSEFLEDGRPTRFLYESILGLLDRTSSNADSPTTPDAPDDEDEVDDTAVNANPRMFGLDTLFNLIRNGQLDLNPPWQRTVVWSPAKQKDLIKSILLGIPIPSIILHHHNPGTIQERYSIIDGKQRLTAICSFLENKFRLPAFKVASGHPLYPCRGRWFDKHGQRGRGLEAAYRNRIMTTQIPVLLFQQVPERRLRQIFNLYNVSSTQLNAAEIRNAIYQDNPVYKMLFVLAGESSDGVPVPGLTEEELERFVSTLQRVLPSTKRFAALDLLCRYLGYSRAPTTHDRFSAASTSTIINRYFDFVSQHERPEDVSREIVTIFQRAQEYFDIEDAGDFIHMAFFRRNEAGERKFEALQAITSMVCARLLNRVELGGVDHAVIDGAVRKVLQRVPYPDKQQYTTIWDHQASRFLALAEELGLNLSTFDGGAFKSFADRMGQVRLELRNTDAAALVV